MFDFEIIHLALFSSNKNQTKPIQEKPERWETCNSKWFCVRSTKPVSITVTSAESASFTYNINVLLQIFNTELELYIYIYIVKPHL